MCLPKKSLIFARGDGLSSLRIMSVHYHPGKVKVVADALSRLYMGSVAHVLE